MKQAEPSYSFVKISNFTRIRALSSPIPLKTGGYTVHHHHSEDFQHEDSRTFGKNNYINYLVLHLQLREIKFVINSNLLQEN